MTISVAWSVHAGGMLASESPVDHCTRWVVGLICVNVNSAYIALSGIRHLINGYFMGKQSGIRRHIR